MPTPTATLFVPYHALDEALPANVARTDAANTFTDDQTIQADLYVTGEINPARLAEQRPKIEQLIGPGSGRTLMSNDLAAGMSLQYDEPSATGKVTVGNYDTQTYQPLLLEADHIALATGSFPPGMEEHVRVHPSGGVTVGEGTAHDTDPGVAVVSAGGLAASYLDLAEGVPLDPPPDVARLHALDVNGFTQCEMRDAAARAVRFASDNVLIAKVTEPAGVVRGQGLYLAGASGANPLVRLARANDIATMPTVGLALDAGAANAFIRVLLSGTLQRIDTSAFPEGVSLFVSTTVAGGFTTTLPNAPDFAQRVGFVTRSHATAGEVLVLTTGVAAPPRLHHASHESGGTDVLHLSAPSRLLGRGSASGAGEMQELTLGTGLTIEGTVLVATAQNSGVFGYSFSTQTTEPPSAQTARVNAPHPYTTATKLWVTFQNANSEDLYFGWMRTPVGSTVLVQDKDNHPQFAEFTITGAIVDKGAYCEIPVSWKANGLALATQACLVRTTEPVVAAVLETRLAALEARMAALEGA